MVFFRTDIILRVYCLLLVGIFISSLQAQEFVTNEVLNITFHVKFESNAGTAFIIAPDSNRYLVTARHLIGSGYSNGDSLIYSVNQEGSWVEYRGKLLLHENRKVDIALIKADFLNTWHSPFNLRSCNTYYGGEAFFLGFPYNIIMSRNFDFGEIPYPIPIIKKALYNGSIEIDSVTHFVWSGHNNSGFSGGPIITKNWKQKPFATYNILCGVVKGFFPGVEEFKTDKMVANFIDNSGVMIGLPVFYIREILQQNKL